MANKPTFYFYDLETSGFRPDTDRIMQFAGQRTTLDLEAIGEPHNLILKLSPDILPGPDAVLIHGITPQRTLTDGVSESQFLELFQKEVATKETIFVGFNTVRFDDEFMRYLLYRNLYDPYKWQWEDDKSRWDLLDAVRMMRALRPDGIKWPFAPDGQPSNRLELLTQINGLDHADAHDALSDVKATIQLAKLVRSKQPKLFDYLLHLRDKRVVRNFVLGGEPYLYTSGKYANEFEKTTVVHTVCEHPDGRSALVFDLRTNPKPYFSMSAQELATAWKLERDNPARLPVKTLKYNRCPAAAPLNVLDEASIKRLSLNMEDIEQHRKSLEKHPEFAPKLSEAVKMLDTARQQRLLEHEIDVDSRLYDNFLNNTDTAMMEKLHQTEPNDIEPSHFHFKDERLNSLLPLYKARNFPSSLNDAEQASWQKHIDQTLMQGGEGSKLAMYLKRIEELKLEARDKQALYLLDELQLFGESLLPTSAFGG